MNQNPDIFHLIDKRASYSTMIYSIYVEINMNVNHFRKASYKMGSIDEIEVAGFIMITFMLMGIS
jgi:hypothetical protein